MNVKRVTRTWHYPINHEGSFWIKWVLSLVTKPKSSCREQMKEMKNWEWSRNKRDKADIKNHCGAVGFNCVSHCLEHCHTVKTLIGRLWNPLYPLVLFQINHAGCVATFCNFVCTMFMGLSFELPTLPKGTLQRQRTQGLGQPTENGSTLTRFTCLHYRIDVGIM